MTILTLGLQVGLVFGQTFPTGFFCSDIKSVFQTELFQFNSNKTFNYVMLGHVGNVLGQGIYKVSNDTLILKFTEHPKDSQPERVDFREGTSGKTIIRVHAELTESNDGGNSIHVYLKNKETGTSTNGNGDAQLLVDKLPETDTLVISSRAYIPVLVPVRHNYDSLNVNVILDRLFMNRQGNLETLKINWCNIDSFGLKRFEGNEVRYQRVSKDSTAKILEEWDEGRPFDKFRTSTRGSVTEEDIERFVHFLTRQNVIRSTEPLSVKPLPIPLNELIDRLGGSAGYSFLLKAIRNEALTISKEYKGFVNFRFSPKEYRLKEATGDTYTSISLPYFNKHKDIVVIQVSDVCPGLCGTDQTLLFYRQGDKWIQQMATMRYY